MAALRGEEDIVSPELPPAGGASLTPKQLWSRRRSGAATPSIPPNVQPGSQSTAEDTTALGTIVTEVLARSAAAPQPEILRVTPRELWQQRQKAPSQGRPPHAHGSSQDIALELKPDNSTEWMKAEIEWRQHDRARTARLQRLSDKIDGRGTPEE